MTNILRNEWNFTGYVISDKAAIQNILMQHNYTRTPLDTAVASIKAGCNMELTQGKYQFFNTQVVVLSIICE